MNPPVAELKNIFSVQTSPWTISLSYKYAKAEDTPLAKAKISWNNL